MNRYFTFILSLFLSSGLYSQTNAKKYWVYFTDKDHSKFSVEDPASFLSQKALERRNKYGIAVNSQDLPVNENYIQQVQAAGAGIVVTSRWLNAVSAEIYTDDQLAAISQLSCVRQITPVGRYVYRDDDVNTPIALRTTGAVIDYGYADNQLEMISVDFLHNNGFRGKNMTIAVLDGGFMGVDTGTAYQTLWNKDQILGVHNFPDNNDSVFFSSLHGTWVLGIMAADLPGIYVGAAPDADYYLFRTEVVDSERVAEEDFWAAGAELADAVGADVINSSLGYTTFDQPSEDHTYADMDGNTTVCTIAADIAASKGILVCNSAGNEGDNAWHYIGAPADGDSVFSIGAVDDKRVYASFSSQGPTYDGRIKPNIAVQGSNFPILNPNGSISFGGGTSFASPLAAGATTCLWQAFPDRSNMEIIQAVQRSASQYNNPDNILGYGIPDYEFAYRILSGLPAEETENYFYVVTGPDNDAIYVELTSAVSTDANIRIFNVSGSEMQRYTLLPDDGFLNSYIKIDFPQHLAEGIYFITLSTETFTQTEKIFLR